MQLPDELTAAIESLLYGTSTLDVRDRAAVLSASYRSAGVLAGRPVESADDALAYAAYRLPGTYAAVRACFSEIQRLKPEWVPRTLLDLGGGPGTVAWAATAVWPGLQQLTIIERSSAMIDLGRRLGEHASSEPVRAANWIRGDVRTVAGIAPAELVTAAYVLGELAPGALPSTVSQWWDSTENTLAAIEPGTPRGFARALKTREHLLAQGAVTVAPCPHDKPCPLPPTDWCHFSQRLARSRVQRTAKDTTLSYEDEKFSYAVLSRNREMSIGSRVIRHPRSSKGMIRLVLCTDEDGVQEVTITRRQGEGFKRARHLKWGSAIAADSPW